MLNAGSEMELMVKADRKTVWSSNRPDTARLMQR